MVFTDAEPIIVSSTFSNVSSATVIFWDSGLWPNTKVELFDSNMHAVAMTQEGIARRAVFSPGGSRDKNVPVQLRPLGVYPAESFDLRPLFMIRANSTYFIELTYEERQADHWKGKLLSKIVRIKTSSGSTNGAPKDNKTSN